MALKKTNYVDKELGITLPEVIAIVQVDTKMGVATFNIAANREKALVGKTVKQVKMSIDFNSNRKEDPRVLAYEKATTPELVEGVEVKPFFYGWEDDIQNIY